MLGIIFITLSLLLFSSFTAVKGESRKVASFLVKPYLMESDESDGNSTQYTGFVKEYLDALEEKTKDTYDITIADGYGKKESNGKWTGMIGQVVEAKADIAAGPITMTLQREEAVDFLYHFQKFEAVAVMLKRHPNKKPTISSVEDFLKQNTIKLGIVEDGPLAKELKESSLQFSKQLWQRLQNDSLAMENNHEGFKRVKWDDNYAFFMESSAADSLINKKPCNYVAIPGGFYKRRYAFAVANQSPLRDSLNKAIGALYYDGTLQKLKAKWLSGDDQCNGKDVLRCSQLLIICLIVAKLFDMFW